MFHGEMRNLFLNEDANLYRVGWITNKLTEGNIHDFLDIEPVGHFKHLIEDLGRFNARERILVMDFFELSAWGR